MANRIWTVLGFWAMGLLLFIVTFIIIHWAVDFATWSTLDSGWAQAIGSIAALAVAIYVMSRQNKHAAKLLTDADMLAYRRRTAAVKAIIERAERVAANVGGAVVKAMNAEHNELNSVAVELEAANMALRNVRDAVNAVPAYELGSYDMAEGIHLVGVNLAILSDAIDRLIKFPALLKTEGTPKTFLSCIDALQTSIHQFKRGAAEFS